MASQYWNSQMEGFNRGMGNIGTALIAGPKMRAEAELMRSRQEELAREAQARTALLGTQAEHISTGDKRLDDYGTAAQAFAAAQTAYQSSPTPENKSALDKATAEFYGRGAKVNNMKVGEIVTALGKSGALQNLVSGSPDFKVAGGMQGQAASVANGINNPKNGRDVARDEFISSLLKDRDLDAGGIRSKIAAYDAQTGRPGVLTNALKSAAGPVVAAPAQPPAAAGPLDNPNGVPPAPAPAAAPAAPANRAPVVSTNAPAMVHVLHPDGKTTGSIPATKLQAALAQGYKQVP